MTEQARPFMEEAGRGAPRFGEVGSRTTPVRPGELRPAPAPRTREPQGSRSRHAASFESQVRHRLALADPAMSGRMIGALQQAGGNRAVQRLLSGPREATLQRCGPRACSCSAAERAEVDVPGPEESGAHGPPAERATSTIATGEEEGDTETVSASPAGEVGASLPPRAASRPAAAAELPGDGRDVQRNGSCTSVSGTPTLPAATLRATLNGNKLGADWDMAADFTSDPADPAVCGPCGEYRQYVKGTFTKNGTTVTHPLCGTNLDPDSFQEDCAQRGGTQYKYGYHSIRFSNSTFSQPDQATGQRWDGYDYPGIRGAPGDRLGIDLQFMGSLVDECNGATLAGSSWSVAGTGTVPGARSTATWSCDASCNLEGSEPQCTGRVTGHGTGPSEEEACRNAKRDAVHKAPRGCYARHCRCLNCSK